MPKIVRDGYEAPSQEDWDRGVRVPVKRDTADKTTKEIGESLGYKAAPEKPKTAGPKGPKPVEPPADASLGMKAAYQRAKREWESR